MDKNIFPAVNHNHKECVVAVLDKAEQKCAKRDARLTPQRRAIFEIIASSHKAIGAYDIIEQMAQSGSRPAPITVYRALEFLMANHLVHRIASNNTYLACLTDHNDGEVLFLICSDCGTVGEINAVPIQKAVVDGAALQGFSISHQFHEVAGQCRHCAGR